MILESVIAALVPVSVEAVKRLIDLRASSRYLAALFVIAAGVVVFYIPGVTEGVLALAADAVGIVFGFLFGSRLVTRK